MRKGKRHVTGGRTKPAADDERGVGTFQVAEAGQHTARVTSSRPALQDSRTAARMPRASRSTHATPTRLHNSASFRASRSGSTMGILLRDVRSPGPLHPARLFCSLAGTPCARSGWINGSCFDCFAAPRRSRRPIRSGRGRVQPATPASFSAVRPPGPQGPTAR